MYSPTDQWYPILDQINMQRQQSKKAPKKQSQRVVYLKKPSKKARPSRPQGVQMMPNGPSPNINSLPASYMTTQLDPTWLNVSGKVFHPELGGGVRVVGRQLLTKVATGAADLSLFVTNNVATALDVNTIQLSPDALNGRLALQARTYDRYCFRKVVLTYVNRVPTTQAGSFALGYVGDAGVPATTFNAVTQMSPAIQASFLTPLARVEIVNDMTTTRTWYTTLDNTSVASGRLTVQGCIVGAPDVTSIGAITMGYIWVDYMIDLYQPTQDEGFTLRLTPAEISAVRAKRELESRDRSNRDQNSDLTEISQLQLRLQQLKTGNLNL
jgi:hypothetical protein